MLSQPREKITTEDGCSIAVYVTGNESGPTLVLANGLGGCLDAWDNLVSFFSARYRIVSWDYRGLYASGAPEDRENLSMEVHIRDALAVLDAMNIEKAVFLGWSMGVQVNFEIARARPEVIEGIVAINGTYTSPFKTVFHSGVPDPVPELACMGLKKIAPLIPYSGPFLEAFDYGLPVIRALGLVSEDVRGDIFRELIKDYLTLDFEIYANILKGLADHDSADFLPKIEAPCLILAGENDFLTPARCSRTMAALIPQSICHVLPGATHYSPMECPEVINQLIDEFLTTS